MKHKNINASNPFTLFMPLNSFQMKTPQNAATNVAPWPRP